MPRSCVFIFNYHKNFLQLPWDGCLRLAGSDRLCFGKHRRDSDQLHRSFDGHDAVLCSVLRTARVQRQDQADARPGAGRLHGQSQDPLAALPRPLRLAIRGKTLLNFIFRIRILTFNAISVVEQCFRKWRVHAQLWIQCLDRLPALRRRILYPRHLRHGDFHALWFQSWPAQRGMQL